MNKNTLKQKFGPHGNFKSVANQRNKEKKKRVKFVCFVGFFGFEVPQFECLCFHAHFVESEVSEVVKVRMLDICHCVLRRTV